MDEFELIKYFKRRAKPTPGVLVGVGDDCCVVRVGSEKIIATTDAIVEGVDFTADDSPRPVGKKAVNISLSDIAAMGAKPVFALATLSMPPVRSSGYAKKVFEGLNRAAAAFECALAGGDLSATSGPVTIQTTVVGRPAGRKIVTRGGAKTGDIVCVTGMLGGSILGKHLRFRPRVSEALYLNAKYDLDAMIDISDGLSGDLAHILEASGRGAVVEAKAIPVSPAARKLSKESGKPPLYHALNDGEDYELLFTLSSREWLRLEKDACREFKTTAIGRITREGYLLERADGETEELEIESYRHSFP